MVESYMYRKLSISSVIIIACVAALFFLHQSPFILSAVLLFIGFGKHVLYPIKKELIWYLFVSLGGGLVEILLVNYEQAWSYATPQFYGIPMYMPLFWGTVGTTIVVTYEGFSQ